METPGWLGGGGGYLNGVDATLVGYTFLVGETTQIKKGERKGEDFTPLSLVPQFAVDGDDESKDEPKTQRLLIGDAETIGSVEDDDQVLNLNEGQKIGKNTEAGIFLGSLCSGGFPAARFGEDPSVVDLRPAIGVRVRLVQEVNVEKTKRQGKQKGTNGKEYDRRDLKVQTVHEVPSEGKSGKAAKPASSNKNGSAGKNKKKDEDDVDIPELAGKTLRAILCAVKGDDKEIAKSKLSMAVLKKLTNDDNREAVREWLFEDDNLAEVKGISYNKKKQIISLDDDAPEDDE